MQPVQSMHAISASAQGAATWTALPTNAPDPQVFSDVFARENQLIRANPRNGTYLACGLLMRGAATISDVNRNVARLRPALRMAHWNNEVRAHVCVCTCVCGCVCTYVCVCVCITRQCANGAASAPAARLASTATTTANTHACRLLHQSALTCLPGLPPSQTVCSNQTRSANPPWCQFLLCLQGIKSYS